MRARVRFFQLRLTDEELRLLKRMAVRNGRTGSAHLRELLRQDAKKNGAAK